VENPPNAPERNEEINTMVDRFKRDLLEMAGEPEELLQRLNHFYSKMAGSSQTPEDFQSLMDNWKVVRGIINSSKAYRRKMALERMDELKGWYEGYVEESAGNYRRLLEGETRRNMGRSL
jgi:hypothetical protein